jgi:cell division protein FtsL
MNKKRIKLSSKKIILPIGLLILVAMSAVYIWIFNYTNMLISDIDSLIAEEMRVETKVKLIRAEIDRLSQSDRIQEIASTQLDMVVPSPETIVVVIEPNFVNITNHK